ncbi:MAG TPA: tRNA lysidine(34) synthetase TilS [Solirubrobacterales bacterium]|nr:tRNA lysidine(34) synthetase TilS [Solirubrobacterales bacterium]
MGKEEALAELCVTVRESGLVEARSSGIVLVSGGPDSACAAAGLVEHCGRPNVHALHVNYGLRESADDDERACRELCARLRIDLRVERPTLAPDGNLQAAAREARYTAAEQLRDRSDADWVATGHTLTDLAETVVYRLAASPGRRGLLGLPRRRGYLVRPLLAIDRRQTRRLALDAGLPFADDPSNLDPRFARNRIRHEVMPVLRELSPTVERNIADTRTELAEESYLLERLAADLLADGGAGGGVAGVPVEALAGADRVLRRIALRSLAERVAGRHVPLGRERAAEIWRLAQEPEGGEIELGGGLRAVCELGVIRFALPDEDEPEAVRLSVPGSCRFGAWEVRAAVRAGPVQPAGPERATLDAAALGSDLVVRTWRDGDRIRPLGMQGTKTLQDLFTDCKVPRSLRHTLPVVAAGDRVAWVAGVAVSEDFRLAPDTREAVIISARVAQ